MQSPDQHRAWLWAARGALVVYALLAWLMIVQRPGLYYDEALMVLGAVQMRHAPTELPLPHDADTWACTRGRCFPLMTMSYIGAIKEYVTLPLFALFGSRTEMVRLVSALFSLSCIWGIALLLGEHVGRPAGAIAALALAINPAFLTTTIFDNGAVAVWMLALGLVCLAISGYARRPRPSAAFWIGAAMGLGVWGRANFVWLLLSILAAAALVLRKKLLAPLAHWIAWIAGGVVGGLPFLIYQLRSSGGTWAAAADVRDPGTLVTHLVTRFFLFSQTLLIDLEHRAMWDGPPLPAWQHWIFPVIAFAAFFVCLAASRRWDPERSLWAQGAALTFLFLALFFFLTDLRVSEHHLITLVPLAIVVTVLACSTLARFRWGRIVSAAIATVYLSSAIYWLALAVEGLHRTRGAGPWSDGVYRLAHELEQKYPAQEIKVMDWGLAFNLYVVSDEKLRLRELYAEGFHQPWIDEIRRGGVFLLNGPDHRQFPEPSLQFLEALAEARPAMRRSRVDQRSGLTYAEIIEIEPNSLHETSGPPPARESRTPQNLDGFYPVETAGWRWTMHNFSFTFDGQNPAGLVLQIFVPDLNINKLGPITLSAQVNGHVLTPATYRASGQYTFRRDLDESWLRPAGNRVEFRLDKWLPSTPADEREFGIVVASIAVEAR
jgi:hypothetical protein